MPGNLVHVSPEDVAKWPPPNYDHPQTRDWMPIFVGIWYGFATFMSGVRLWLRAYKKQAGGLGLDDLLLFVAWIGSTAVAVTAILSTEVYMVNRHMWDIPPGTYESIAKVVWGAEMAFLITSCSIKVSVLLFYRRLVNGLCARYWVWALVATIIFTVAYTAAFILALFFNCTPTEAYWRSFNPTYTEPYHCANTTIINILAGVFAATSDLCAVLLPMIITWNFTMSRKQKIALNCIYCLGFLVVAASGARTYHLWEVGHESDVTTYIYNSYVWAILELNLAIICASAPALRSLLRDHLDTPMKRYRNAEYRPAETRSYSNTSKQVLVDRRTDRLPSDFSGYQDSSLRHGSQSEVEDGSYRSMENCHLVRTPSYPDGEAYGMQTMGSPGRGRRGSD